MRVYLAGSHPLRARLRTAIAPDLLPIEVASSLLKYVRAGSLPADEARRLLDEVVRSPLELRPLRPLASAALDAAVRLGISAYDATYLVLAELEDRVLLTADVRLANAAPRAELVT